MSEPITVFSRFNRVAAVPTVLVGIGLLGGALVGTVSPVWAAPAGALLVVLAWAALWRPVVCVDDDGVLLVNVTHRVRVPWEALIDIDTQYALRLHTPRGRFTAWSAPAPGALSSTLAGARASRRERDVAQAALRPGDVMGTESGDAAQVVREQWRARREAGRIVLGAADTTEIRRRWHLGTIVLIAALVTAAVAGIATVG